MHAWSRLPKPKTMDIGLGMRLVHMRIDHVSVSKTGPVVVDHASDDWSREPYFAVFPSLSSHWK